MLYELWNVQQKISAKLTKFIYNIYQIFIKCKNIVVKNEEMYYNSYVNELFADKVLLVGFTIKLEGDFFEYRRDQMDILLR